MLSAVRRATNSFAIRSFVTRTPRTPPSPSSPSSSSSPSPSSSTASTSTASTSGVKILKTSTTTITNTPSMGTNGAPPPPSTVPLCECLKPAIQRTVTKAGPTHGKSFWGCAEFVAGSKRGCSFFKWSGDAPVEKAGKVTPNGPKCKCNLPSVLLTVSRPGHNFGRTFYRCGNGLVNQGTADIDNCDFFEWSEPRTDDSAAVAAAAAAAGLPPVDDSAASIVCGCNKPALMLRVSKSSPNVGRRFLKCPDSKCGFFAWVDL